MPTKVENIYDLHRLKILFEQNRLPSSLMIDGIICVILFIFFVEQLMEAPGHPRQIPIVHESTSYPSQASPSPQPPPAKASYQSHWSQGPMPPSGAQSMKTQPEQPDPTLNHKEQWSWQEQQSAAPKPENVPTNAQVPVQEEMQMNNSNKETTPQPESSAEPVEAGPLSPIQKIRNIREQADTFHNQVDKFQGQRKDKAYRYLEEMLTRLLLQLDQIETGGDETVRQERKAAVKCVQSALDHLELKEFAQTVDQPSANAKSQQMDQSLENKPAGEMEHAN